MSILDSNQLAFIQKELRSSKKSVEKETPDQMSTFKEHAEPTRKKDYDPSHITRDGISSMHESIKTVKENHPEDPTLVFGNEVQESSTNHYATAIREHSDHVKKKNVTEGLFDGDPQEAPVSRKEFFKVLSTSLSSLGGGGVGINDVTEYVDDKIENAFNVDFGNTFVNVTGDSMSGGLFVNLPANNLDTALRINTRSGATIKLGAQDARYPMDIHMPSNTQGAWGATVRIATDFKVKKDGNNIDGSNLLDVQRDNNALVLDGTLKTKKLEHFSGTNTLIEQTSGIYRNVSNKFTGSNYGSMMRRTFYNGTPYIDYSIGGLEATMDKDANHPHVYKQWRGGVQYHETKTGTIPGDPSAYRFTLRRIFDERQGGQSGGLQTIHELRDPVYTTDAVNFRSLNSRSSRLQPSYIGDSVQRSIIESGLSTPLDSLDSTGGVGTMFVNTSGVRPRLQFWKDSQWQDLRSKFDSGEVLGIVNSLRYTTANHDSDTLAQVDSAYVQARVNFPADTIIDSNDVVGIVDSAYVQARQITYDFLDSSEAISLFDSAYVQARVTFPVDQVGLDSDDVIGIVDSAYVQARQIPYDSAQVQQQIDSAVSNGLNPFDQDLNTTDIVTFDQVVANLDGAIEFHANNRSGATIYKGEAVYIENVDGNKPTVALADASDPSKMPAFGLALADAADNADITIVTLGTLPDIDTSSFEVGDTLYIGTTPGEITTSPPSGVDTPVQNIGRVIRSHGISGSIRVGGAGRSSATPNLDAGQIFYGSDSNRSVPTLLDSVIDSDYVQTRINAATLDFSSVPTSDPSVAGLVWRDSDNGNMMRISVG